jgi:hypothetical protein
MFTVPLLVLLRLAQHLQLVCIAGLECRRVVPPSPEVPPAPEEPPPSEHGSHGPGRVHQLEAVFVLLVVVGVLGAAGAVLGVVLVHVATVLVRVPGPVGYLKQKRCQGPRRTIESRT